MRLHKRFCRPKSFGCTFVCQVLNQLGIKEQGACLCKVSCRKIACRP